MPMDRKALQKLRNVQRQERYGKAWEVFYRLQNDLDEAVKLIPEDIWTEEVQAACLKISAELEVITRELTRKRFEA